MLLKKLPLVFFLMIGLLFFAVDISAQVPKIENGGLVLDNPVLFKTGTAELLSESDAPLQQVKLFLEAKESITLLRVEGHVAAGNDEAKNQTLTEKRALAVCTWLIKKGIDCKRLIAVGFGSTKPVADNATPEGKAKNSRIEFKMAALRDRLIGGMPADGGGKVAGEVCK